MSDACCWIVKSSVRTTLQIDDDLMEIAKQLAAQRGATMGRVISDLVRRSLEPKRKPRTHNTIRNGVPLFVPKTGAKKPSLALVNKLRDEP